MEKGHLKNIFWDFLSVILQNSTIKAIITPFTSYINISYQKVQLAGIIKSIKNWEDFSKFPFSIINNDLRLSQIFQP